MPELIDFEGALFGSSSFEDTPEKVTLLIEKPILWLNNWFISRQFNLKVF
jgi:hypothetical protein